MKPLLFYSGAGLAVAGAGLPLILPSLPSDWQSGPLQPVGVFVINNQSWIVLVGILIILASVFL